MRDKLERLIAAYEELEKKMMDPGVVADPKEYARIAKEHASQAELVAKAREYLGALNDIDAAKEMLHEASDSEEKEMLQQDISENEEKLPALEDEIKVMLIPGDPNDEKDTIVEIRAGVGGDEAAIFAGDLFDMYGRLAQARKWKVEVLSASPSEAGGYKTIEFKLMGDKVYSVMKYESGVHRVQRIPKTESQGRIQTSTATVAVLPEADEIDILFDLAGHSEGGKTLQIAVYKPAPVQISGIGYFAFFDVGDGVAAGDGGAVLGEDLFEDAAYRCGQFEDDFVGFEVNEVFAGAHGVAGFFGPVDEGGVGAGGDIEKNRAAPAGGQGSDVLLAEAQGGGLGSNEIEEHGEVLRAGISAPPALHDRQCRARRCATTHPVI